MPSDTVASGTQAARGPKRVFQIAYDERLRFTRQLLLESCGYVVNSITGNDAALEVLSSHPTYDLFIVGHSDSHERRRQMISWLRVNYPGAKILALNPPWQSVPNADYNVPLDHPEEWLQAVASALA